MTARSDKDLVVVDTPADFPSDSEELWNRMKVSFEIDANTIKDLWFESHKDAVNKTGEEWFDEDIGLKVPPWTRLPYRNTIDQEELRTSLENAKSLIPTLETHLAKRKLTVEFLHAWGEFHRNIGFIYTVYFSEGDDLVHIRGGAKTRANSEEDGRKKWIASVIIHLVDNKGLTRERAEDEFVTYVQRAIEINKYPPGKDRSWLESLLNKYRTGVVGTYGKNKISLREMREFIKECDVEIPPIPDELLT